MTQQRMVRLKSGERITVEDARSRGLEQLATGHGRFHTHYVAKDGGPVCNHAVADWEEVGQGEATCGTCRRIEASPTARRKILGAL